jgi:hypothetical protein
MLPRVQWTGEKAAMAIVVLGAFTLLSCGGAAGPESLTGPMVSSEPQADEEGSVSASHNGHHKVLVCHKGNDLRIAVWALPWHLRHGDKLGRCAGAEASCPCFTQAGIDEVASGCSGQLNASCPLTYSLQLFCVAGSGGGGSASNLGYFEARVDSGTCSTVAQDPITGDQVVDTKAVTPSEYQACRRALVTSSPYQTTNCPR